MADNLPTNLLAAPSRALFLSAIQGAGYSVSEERTLSCLPVSQIRQQIATKTKSLGELLTRPECDKCLRLLALALPRAGLSPDDAHDMLDLYFGLLHKACLTGAMLRSAAEQYVMRPSAGKPKFFPDPGQLAELCADDIRTRNRALDALKKGLDSLGTTPEAEENSFDAADRLRKLGDEMRASTARAPSDSADNVYQPPPLNTARPNTDAAELRDHINKKIGTRAA